jgi:hypothetical protein
MGETLLDLVPFRGSNVARSVRVPIAPLTKSRRSARTLAGAGPAPSPELHGHGVRQKA